MTKWLALYIVAGAALMLLHPGMRASILAPLRSAPSDRMQSLLVFGIVLVVALALWPMALIWRTAASSSDAATVAAIKLEFLRHGKNPVEDDGVLRSYYRAIAKQVDSVAHERGETLPDEIRKKVVLHYLRAWSEMNEQRLGIAMPLLLSDGMETYRQQGIHALLRSFEEHDHMA